MAAAVWMAFADKVGLNIQNYHKGIYVILQVASQLYRSGFWFQKNERIN